MPTQSAGKLKFSFRRSLPIVLQSEASECGLASICMLANYYGHQIDLFTLRRRYPISLKGATLRQLINTSSLLRLSSRTIKMGLEDLKHVKEPIILHWDLNHFVVLKSTHRNGLTIHDPAKGVVKLTWQEVSSSFTGIALELRPGEDFKKKEETLKLGFSVLWSSITGLNSSIAQILILSLLIQSFLLISPYFIKLVVDNVVISNDGDFLNAIGIGFLLLLIVQVITQAFRSWLIVYLQSTLNIQLISNLFSHLINLPLGWFGKRFVGDIISRFSSLDYIKNLLSDGFVEGVVDGSMALLTLVMMYIFSPSLATITLIAVVLLTLTKVLFFSSIRNHTKESIQMRAVSTGMFYEAVRSVQPIKVFNGESVKQEKLENANADWMNADIKLNRLKITQSTIKDLLTGIEYILIVWIGALWILNEHLTVGALIAFIAYRQQFSNSFHIFLEKVFEWKMMGLHLSRIADIALEEQEDTVSYDAPLTEIRGHLECKNVSFRYGDNEPYIFKNLSFEIKAGECVVIISPSGFGKTTLLKVMMGLLPSTEGHVKVDGRDIHQIGLKNYRQFISAVMQGDNLLSGSVADNISFFSLDADQNRLEEVSKQACIYDDIMSMPMGFHTLAGDMGSTFSGGQIQRILLARAIYKNPKILFLDEASSALDVATERKINDTLKNMGITRIMIAHRKETIDMADRIIDLRILSLNNDTNATQEKDKPKLEAVK